MERSDQRMFDFRSGGWVLLLAALITIAVAAWGLAGIFISDEPRIGDGQTLESYNFNLSTTLIPIDRITPGHIAKDHEVRAIDDPRFYTVEEVERITEEERGKYLVTHDRVIGVAFGDEAKAYPLSILAQHEIVNDTVGGVPVAVTYNPLCDSAAVFDRRVGGETRNFGVSGLLFNSNLLMYDRQDDLSRESLWSQVQRRAVTGPAAAEGTTLEVLPAALVHWEDWLREYPETLVLKRDPNLLKRYKRTYNRYFSSDELFFPVEPLPDEGQLKAPMIVIFDNGAARMFLLEDLYKSAAGGIVTIDDSGPSGGGTSGGAIRFEVGERPLIAWPKDARTGETLPTMTLFRFAWHAMTHQPQ